MVYVPGITTRLYPRKGGGGGGKTGGGGGGSSGGGKTGSSGGGGSSSFGGGRSVPLSGSTVGGRTASTFGNGGGRPSTISSGPFAGRQQGGGTRDQVYGSQAYGSGYPGRGVGAGAGALGVAGLGFPFLFWPVVWGGGFGYGAGYLHTHEYGDADNSSRPGGPMTQTAFADKGSNNTFHLLADNTTVATLIDIVAANCTLGNTTMLVPMSFNTSDPSQPRPEQAIQYYRASSIVLTLDGYNDTSALVNDSSLPPTPLPAWVNHTFLDCLNQTIGNAAPLVDGAGSLMAVSPSLGLLGMIWLSVFAFLAA